MTTNTNENTKKTPRVDVPALENVRRVVCRFPDSPRVPAAGRLVVWDRGGYQPIREDAALGYGVQVARDVVNGDGYQNKQHWYVFANVDCFDPPLTLVFADSFEQAYYAYVEENVDRLKIDDTDLADYGEDFNVSENGTPIDTESVQGWEVELLRVEM